MMIDYYNHETRRVESESVEQLVSDSKETLAAMIDLLFEKGIITESDVRNLLRLSNP